MITIKKIFILPPAIGVVRTNLIFVFSSRKGQWTDTFNAKENVSMPPEDNIKAGITLSACILTARSKFQK